MRVLGSRVPLKNRIAKFTRRAESGCLEWTGGLSSSGYAVMQVDYKTRRVTHIVWELANGPVAEGKYMCHSCDDPLCVELDHLFEGTPTENMQDAVRKNRQAKGSRMPQSKVTERQVTEIRELLKTQRSPAVGALYGISPRTCRAIGNHESWKHVL